MSHHHSVLQRVLASRVVIIAIVALLCIGASAAALIHRHTIAHAFTLATTHQPERYSELYFDNSAHLPLYSPAYKAERVSFHIANHQGKTTTYAYRVVFQVGAKTSVLRSGSVTIADGSSADISVTYTMSAPNLSGQLNVQLEGRSEHIAYRMKS
ncbi:MAG TPA: hypothetical protein VJP80_02160 [Candidatus Saccharimonadales bacterium]|nr:hypothetical protein [Candidatus Saccharimonadales bacterium]